MNKRQLLFIVMIIFFNIFTAGTVYAVHPIKANETPNRGQQDIEKRLNLLEFALISQSPREVVNTWAKGVMTRNGALQYAVLCDSLQSKYKSDFESWEWWTGSSSPWIESYKISTGEPQSDGTWRFTIKFQYTDSINTTYSSASSILVGAKKVDKHPLPTHCIEQQWCVMKIDTLQYLQREENIQNSNQ